MRLTRAALRAVEWVASDGRTDGPPHGAAVRPCNEAVGRAYDHIALRRAQESDGDPGACAGRYLCNESGHTEKKGSGEHHQIRKSNVCKETGRKKKETGETQEARARRASSYNLWNVGCGEMSATRRAANNSIMGLARDALLREVSRRPVSDSASRINGADQEACPGTLLATPTCDVLIGGIA